MASFFKSFGKGILYVLVLPFLLVVLAVYGVLALIVFLFMFFKGVILFFTGRSLFNELPEDKKAAQIIKANTVNLDPDAPENQPKEGHVALGPTYHQEPVNSDPFYVPEYLKTRNEDMDLTTQEAPSIENREVDQIDYSNLEAEENYQEGDNEQEANYSQEEKDENDFSSLDEEDIDL